MAKIFRTEELSVNGDNIRLTADANGNLVIKDSSSNVVTSTTIIASDVSSLTFKDLDLDADVSSLKVGYEAKDADLDFDISSLKSDVNVKDLDLDSDISSLQSQRDADEASNASDVSSLTFKDLDLDADVSSLKVGYEAKDTDLDFDISSLKSDVVTKDLDLDSDISSLQSQRDTDEASNASDVSSLTFKDLDLDADVSSLNYKIGENDVLATSVTIDSTAAAANTGDRYDATNARVTVDYGRTFSGTPKVVGIMRAAAGEPIIGCQLISVSTTEAQFQLSDDVATDGSYTIEVLISL
jgi:hypothetical protein